MPACVHTFRHHPGSGTIMLAKHSKSDTSWRLDRPKTCAEKCLALQKPLLRRGICKGKSSSGDS